MADFNKRLLRLAAAIHSELAPHHGHERRIELPSRSWDCCVELVRKIHRAEMRGWHLAAAELRHDLGYTIPSVQAELGTLVSQLPRVTSVHTIAPVGELYADLLSLEMDFDEMEYDLRGRWLSVITEPITLNNIYLGPFEIRLDWGRAWGDSAYRVIAKDPHPPESRENVTHPHIQDEVLCEGHGRQAIRQALAQGRLLDFFTLVANGLRTYNEESPFVALELWNGSTCADCGAVVDEDEGYTCQRCEETVCESCENTCSSCGDYCCSQCTAVCAACDNNFCRGCKQTCQGCRGSFCPNCLTEDERCLNCHEEPSRPETDCDAGPAADRAAVQPHGLGQALIRA